MSDYFDDKEIRKRYLDQVKYPRTRFEPVTSSYTPEGIRRMEDEISKRIMILRKSGGDTNELANEIRNNRHLHQSIKDNLLLNLQPETDNV